MALYISFEGKPDVMVAPQMQQFSWFKVMHGNDLLLHSMYCVLLHESGYKPCIIRTMLEKKTKGIEKRKCRRSPRQMPGKGFTCNP